MPEDRRPLTINGQQFRPTMADVEAAMARAPARAVPSGGWWCQVGDRKYPLKVVVAETLGIPRRSFSLPHAQAFARYVGLKFDKKPGVYVR